MARFSVNIDDEWLEAAQHELGTKTKAATVNEALRLVAERAKVREAIAVLDSLGLDLTGEEVTWRFDGGRDLESLKERARREAAEFKGPAA